MSNKKVYIEGLGLVEGHFSGIGQYILGVLKGLDSLIEKERLAGNNVPEIKVIIPYNSLDRFKSFGFVNIRPKVLPMPFGVLARLWHRDLVPPLELFCGRGYYIFPRFVGMNLALSKSALVIYDLSFELYKQYSDERNAQFLSTNTAKYVKKADKIVTISENARKEIIDFYKVKPRDVLLAYPAADQTVLYRRGKKEIDAVKFKYGIKGDYILALSNLEPRKNLDSLIDAYCSLPLAYREKYALLLVGVSGWKIEKLFKKIIDKVEEGYNIIRPSDYVSDIDKASIISGASMLVYPSHYEGFGMPPLEALACGVPVITSNNSSLPESVGSAGKLVKCDNVPEIAKAIKYNLDNINKITDESIVKGPMQAAKFSWEKSAEVYFNLIMEQK